jgi:hypothetical protein
MVINMNEKTAKRLTWAILLLVPILPSYVVIAAINVTLFGAICFFLLEYFAFQYVIALFIQRLALRIQRERQKLAEKETTSADNKEAKIE